MASANGRHRSDQPICRSDEIVSLTSEPGQGPGGVPIAVDAPPGDVFVQGMAGGADVGQDDAGVESGGAYDVVKQSMLSVRQPYGLPDEPMRAVYKRLLAFLTDRELPGGKRRAVPKVTLEATACGWKATINDSTISMKYPVEFKYLHQLFAALSTGFTNPAAKWIETEYGEAAKARKEEERKRLAAQSDSVYDAAKGGRKDPSDAKS